jgi:hypothetical protein
MQVYVLYCFKKKTATTSAVGWAERSDAQLADESPLLRNAQAHHPPALIAPLKGSGGASYIQFLSTK